MCVVRSVTSEAGNLVSQISSAPAPSCQGVDSVQAPYIMIPSSPSSQNTTNGTTSTDISVPIGADGISTVTPPATPPVRLTPPARTHGIPEHSHEKRKGPKAFVVLALLCHAQAVKRFAAHCVRWAGCSEHSAGLASCYGQIYIIDPAASSFFTEKSAAVSTMMLNKDDIHSSKYGCPFRLMHQSQQGMGSTGMAAQC